MGEALTQALAAGDPAAFAALYDRLGPRLYATAHTLTGSAAEAEDIVQDLFVELATHRHRLNEVNDLEAYLFTSLRQSQMTNSPERDRLLTAMAYAERPQGSASSRPFRQPTEPPINHAVLRPGDRRTVLEEPL